MEWLFLLVALIAVAMYWKSRRERSLRMLPKEFVVFDLETTGLKPDHDEIIEIGAIRIQRNKSRHATFSTLVRPGRQIPAKITRLTGITQEMVDTDGVPLDEALRSFVDFIGGRRLVAHNADFDAAFLRVGFKNTGIPKPTNPLSCSLDMARRAWPKRRSYRLSDLARDGKLDQGGAHRALADAQRAALVYAAAAKELNSPH